MKDFKFFKENDTKLYWGDNSLLAIQPQITYDNVEFCFQFGENEPVPFMTGSEFCHITLNNTSEGNMIFTDNNNTFKLFARERI
jgi:hypothetical protein